MAGTIAVCCAIGAASTLAWIVASVACFWACHLVTNTAVANADGTRGKHSKLALWARKKGFNVGYCIVEYARVELYCAVVLATSVSVAVAAAVWDRVLAWQTSFVVSDDHPVDILSREAAVVTDVDALLITTGVFVVAAVAYLAFRAVAWVRVAHGGVVPFVMRFFGGLITGAIRWHIDTTWTWLTLKYFAASDIDFLKDGLPIFDGVDMVRHRYGGHHDECYNYIFPCDRQHSARRLRASGVAVRGVVRVALKELPSTQSLEFSKVRVEPPRSNSSGGGKGKGSGGHVPKNFPVAYFHGGGFVAANACVLTQSVVPLARGGAAGGFQIYAADYPMGQDGAFPMPVLSGLKLLRHLRRDRGIAACHVYGDSAGACVASFVTVLVCNPALLRQFQKSVRNHHKVAAAAGRPLLFALSDYDDVLCPEASADDDPAAAALESGWFPRVVSFLSVYGILDGASWRVAPKYISSPGSPERRDLNDEFSLEQHPQGPARMSSVDGRTQNKPSTITFGIPSVEDVRVKLGPVEYGMCSSGVSFVVDFVYLPPTDAERACYTSQNGVGFFLDDVLRSSGHCEERQAHHESQSHYQADGNSRAHVHFPPSLLVCGNRDPLLLSALRLFRLFDELGHSAGLLEADARHAFVGVPPCLMSDSIATASAVAAADGAILDFLESNGRTFSASTKVTTVVGLAAKPAVSV